MRNWEKKTKNKTLLVEDALFEPVTSSIDKVVLRNTYFHYEIPFLGYFSELTDIFSQGW